MFGIYGQKDIGLYKLGLGIRKPWLFRLLLHKVTQKTHPCIFVPFEIESIGLSELYLSAIVIEGLFWKSYNICSLLKSIGLTAYSSILINFVSIL